MGVGGRHFCYLRVYHDDRFDVEILIKREEVRVCEKVLLRGEVVVASGEIVRRQQMDFNLVLLQEALLGVPLARLFEFFFDA